MGDVIRTDRFGRQTARQRARLRERFARRRPWEMEHDRTMDEFRRIVGDPAMRRRSD